MRSELPGVVLEVHVAPGASVVAGQEVCLLESMKMEIPVLTTVSGRVTDVRVAPGRLLAAGDVVAGVDPAGEPHRPPTLRSVRAR